MSDWVIWGALILASGAGIAAFVLLAVRALEAWRRLGDSRRDVVRRLDEIAAKAETTAERVALAGDTAELRACVSRLRLSLARLAVLRNALDEAKVSVGRTVPLP
jgi:prophage DNA circulation protein